MDKEHIGEALFDLNMEKVYEALYGESSAKDISRGKDALTGLYYKRSFFEKAEEFLSEQSMDQEFCLVAVDVEHFKLFNEWYGREAGDKFLTDIAVRLRDTCEARGGVAGYLGDDDFALIISQSRDLLESLQYSIIGRVKEYEDSAGFLPAFGVYFIEDRSVPVSTMYDRAIIALSKIKGNYAKRMNFYEHGMMLKMEEEHHMLCAVPKALFKHEFIFYLQPKCNMSTGKIVGAEALVRWRRADGTLISPKDFIPVLENNGFITNVDKYVWEEVCHFQRSLIDRGIRPVPISINVSRVDIFSMNVPRFIGNLLRSYHLDPKLVEIEITESIYSERLDTVNNVVHSLQKRGMKVLMDDFGSGYSSLNMLNDVNIDVLKLDMKFLDISEKTMGKGLGILEAVVNMARMMGMKVIVEGVETKEQVDFLIGMGCEYAQGYFFFKPVTAETFEGLLRERKLFDYSGIKLKKNNQLHIRELLNENLFSETIVNNILGAIAFAEYYNGTVEIIRTNEQYDRIIGTDGSSDGVERRFPLNSIIEEDRAGFIRMFQKAYEHPLDGAVSEIRYQKADGRIVWYRIRAFFLREQDGRRMYYGSVSDIREEKKREQELSITEKKLENALRLAENNCLDWNLCEDTFSLINTFCTDAMKNFNPILNDKYVIIKDFSHKYRELFSARIINYGKFREYINGLILGEDKNARSMDAAFSNGQGEILWIRLSCEPVIDIYGKVSHIIGSYTDITRQRQQENMLVKQAATDELTGLYNRHGGIPLIKKYLENIPEDESAAFIMIDLDNFKSANDNYGHIFGDRLLKKVADIMHRCFRDKDIACRIGGDEFIILCKDICIEDIDKKCRDILQKISELKPDAEIDYEISCSAGYVMIPKDGVKFEDLYKKADAAMFSAKKAGKNTCKGYES